MRHLRITSDCLVKGEHTPAGTEANYDVLTAQKLLDAGVAVELKSEKVLGPGRVENRDPKPENRDPKPKGDKGKGGKKDAAEPPAAPPAPPEEVPEAPEAPATSDAEGAITSPLADSAESAE